MMWRWNIFANGLVINVPLAANCTGPLMVIDRRSTKINNFDKMLPAHSQQPTTMTKSTDLRTTFAIVSFSFILLLSLVQPTRAWVPYLNGYEHNLNGEDEGFQRT